MIDVKIKCDSCKFVDGCVDYGWSECKKFTQKPSEPITNEEYIKSCTTEQLAEWLEHHSDFCEICEKHCDNDTGMQCNGDFKERWVEWLKKPHNSSK